METINRAFEEVSEFKNFMRKSMEDQGDPHQFGVYENRQQRRKRERAEAKQARKANNEQHAVK